MASLWSFCIQAVGESVTVPALGECGSQAGAFLHEVTLLEFVQCRVVKMPPSGGFR